MNEEQNQLVRYSRILSDLDNDSFENLSPQSLVTSKNEAKTFKRKKILLGVGLFVIIISILIIVAVTSSRIDSTNTIMTQNNSSLENSDQNNSSQENSNSSTTIVPIFNDSKMISHKTIQTKVSPASFGNATSPPETDYSKIEDEGTQLLIRTKIICIRIKIVFSINIIHFEFHR